MARGKGISRRELLRAGCCTAASFGMTAALGRLEYDSRPGGGPLERLPGAGLHLSLWRKRQQQPDRSERFGRLPELRDDSSESGVGAEFPASRSLRRPGMCLTDCIHNFRDCKGYSIAGNWRWWRTSEHWPNQLPDTQYQQGTATRAGQFVFALGPARPMADGAV